MEILRKVVVEQGETIANMNAREEESKSTITVINQRVSDIENKIDVLEKQLSLNAESEMHHMILHHDKTINELLDRPLIDQEQTIRLDVVERKLASFYGEDTNVLGRVAHLENLRAADKSFVDELKTGLNNIVNASTKSREEIYNIQQIVLSELEPRLARIEESHTSPEMLKEIVKSIIIERGVAGVDQLNDIKDMLNSLANECKRDTNALQFTQQENVDQLSSRIDSLEEAQSAAGNSHHGAITCYGSDQSARLAVIEARMTDHTDWIRANGRLADDISRLKNDLSKNISSSDHLKEETGRIRLSVDRLDTDYLRMVHVVEGLRSQVEGLDRTFNLEFTEKMKDIESLMTDAVNQSKTAALAMRPLDKGAADTAQLEDSVDKIKEFIRALEQRVFVLAGECREGLELLQGNVDRKIEIISNWVANNTNPPGGSQKGISSNSKRTSKDPMLRTKVPDILRSAVSLARDELNRSGPVDLQHDNNTLLRRDLDSLLTLNISSLGGDLDNKEDGVESSTKR